MNLIATLNAMLRWLMLPLLAQWPSLNRGEAIFGTAIASAWLFACFNIGNALQNLRAQQIFGQDTGNLLIAQEGVRRATTRLLRLTVMLGVAAALATDWGYRYVVFTFGLLLYAILEAQGGAMAQVFLFRLQGYYLRLMIHERELHVREQRMERRAEVAIGTMQKLRQAIADERQPPESEVPAQEPS